MVSVEEFFCGLMALLLSEENGGITSFTIRVFDGRHI